MSSRGCAFAGAGADLDASGGFNESLAGLREEPVSDSAIDFVGESESKCVEVNWTERRWDVTLFRLPREAVRSSAGASDVVTTIAGLVTEALAVLLEFREFDCVDWLSESGLLRPECDVRRSGPAAF